MSMPLSFAYNAQKDIEEVGYRQPSDDAAFKEVAAVLIKHGLEKRYGLTLLHKHFDLAPDEVMVEHTDVERRTLISKPVVASLVPKENLVEVTWALSAEQLTGACRQRCYSDMWTNGHVSNHSAEGSHHDGFPFPSHAKLPEFTPA